ncbi:hypothetical protein CONLIGDRAFT_147945 [Coniochaeta ligniaria NRRL 30616]|uniref:Uncharacterized protein n=1 Tax=Coniochaeta ligniaria NRRL 30616 TaxID=1408157 RepID=A0A1J7J0R2_9PEZI|nr:hypothetical protein CONLIGDRAFT_147945 [Coniochaeta ligniaria NRRL 30616]
MNWTFDGGLEAKPPKEEDLMWGTVDALPKFQVPSLLPIQLNFPSDHSVAQLCNACDSATVKKKSAWNKLELSHPSGKAETTINFLLVTASHVGKHRPRLERDIHHPPAVKVWGGASLGFTPFSSPAPSRCNHHQQSQR